MKKLWLAAVLTAGFLGLDAYSDTVTSVNVVGYVNLTVHGGAADTYTLIAAPMTKMPVARGTISGNTTTTITDNNATWAAGSVAPGGNAAGELGSSTYYVEVTSGLFEGRHFYISANTATELTLSAAMADIAAGNLADATYKIIPANRIRDIFGEPGSVALLGGGSSALADTISLMQPSGWSGPVFYKNSGFPIENRENWIQSGSIVNDLVVDRDTGVLVLRKAGGTSVELTVVGEVSANTQASIVIPGFSLIGGMSAVAIPIGQTSLTNVLAGGASSALADNLYAWDNGWSGPVFYKDGGFPIENRNKWIQGGVIVDDTFMINPGTAYLVRKAGTESGVWDRPSPLQ